MKNPADVLKVGQRVQATVMEVDMPRKRIALSLKTRVEIGPRGDRKAEAGKRDVQRYTGAGARQLPPRRRPERPELVRHGAAEEGLNARV